ncbi:MAG: 16S rRNA (uracil(1498)-N(3))-methyltransferase [Candidatus Omnitrophica bacterium]|nr:16S rRNA (uracil(1498)-N(3))-methyltransferase [Candidatus Omnitrophota bacterium]
MSRFFVSPQKVRDNKILIDGEEAHHILDVMRMQDGDNVTVFDGTGNEYSGFIENSDRAAGRLTVRIVRTDKPSARRMPRVTLAQAIPKKSKMDYIVEKATELGVNRIIPLVTKRTIVRPDDRRRAKKVDRWKKLAVEAAKQCGRTDVPEIEQITQFSDMVSRMDQYDLVLFASLRDDTIPLRQSLEGFKNGDILVFIGPEGDFTPEEAEMACAGNCRFVSLGDRVLKSDTAGLALLSVLDYEFSE